MFRKMLSRAVGLAAAIMFFSTFASAQMGQVEGTVRLAGKPVPGALIDIYRTDIKGHWDTKTDKNGHYIHLGLPLAGNFVFIVSGPGITPSYLAARITQMPVVDFTVEPGDGHLLTFEEVQKAMKSGGAVSSPGKPAPPVDKAKMEAVQKEQQEAKDLQASYDQAVKHYNAGVEQKKANNFQGALSELEQVSAVDISKNAAFIELSHKAYANIAEIHSGMGADLYNQGLKPENKAEAKKLSEQAKQHFLAAVDSITKAIATAANDKNPNINVELVVYYGILARNSNVLIERFGEVDRVEPTVKAVDAAEAIDAPNQVKWEIVKGDIYRAAFRTDDASAVYKKILVADPNNVDALYSLGLALLASSEKEKIQESVNALADFVAKAPATDKRVKDARDTIDMIKNQFKIEAEKPAAPARRKKP
jgi:tetratricopeptide (TPR) repeat protein